MMLFSFTLVTPGSTTQEVVATRTLIVSPSWKWKGKGAWLCALLVCILTAAR